MTGMKRSEWMRMIRFLAKLETDLANAQKHFDELMVWQNRIVGRDEEANQ